MVRSEERGTDALRSVTFEFDVAPHAHGSVLVSFGNTRVICAVMIEEGVPRWMKEQGVQGGWITSEYSMLPYSTLSRKPRDMSRGKPDARALEIQRLIGRSLRAAVDLKALGPRTLWVDCDVLQADGGTRTASITGASLAVLAACRTLIEEGKLRNLPLRHRVAAVSVGVVGDRVLLDLDYQEDKAADVDLNLVMNEALHFVEVQGSGEEASFSPEQMQEMLAVGMRGIRELLTLQAEAIKELENN